MSTNLRQAGVGGLQEARYWSSTETIAGSSWYFQVSFGSFIGNDNKAQLGYVRPVRAF
jgi:hypothetical protein